ncbi:plasmid mobilization protein [Bradyrhizobium sp.]|uniref:plasmid mobilization protein n=1 Tax=Bradyrhizobium sp. TaxID=376 RepID=UPI0039E2627A
MARPRTYQQAARTHVVTVRVTPSEHARLSAEAAQLGVSLAGLAERYLSKGYVQTHDHAPGAIHPATIAELKRIAGALDAIVTTVPAPENIEKVAHELSTLLRLLIRDELLAQRIRTLKDRTTANDSAPSGPRQEFQRVVHVRAARSEREDQ